MNTILGWNILTPSDEYWWILQNKCLIFSSTHPSIITQPVYFRPVYTLYVYIILLRSFFFEEYFSMYRRRHPDKKFPWRKSVLESGLSMQHDSKRIVSDFKPDGVLWSRLKFLERLFFKAYWVNYLCRRKVFSCKKAVDLKKHIFWSAKFWNCILLNNQKLGFQEEEYISYDNFIN